MYIGSPLCSVPILFDNKRIEECDEYNYIGFLLLLFFDTG